MSYILDALKKQEQEREIGHTPTVETQQSSSGVQVTQGTLALWVTIVFLLALVAFLVGFLWSKLEAPPSVAQPVASTSPATPDSRPNSEPAATAKPVKQFSAPVVPKPEPQPRQQTAVAKSPTPQRKLPVASTAPKTFQDTPLLDNLSYTERQSLPPLSLDVHVYAEQAERRFVLLNLKKMREGDKLDEIYLEAITPAGVVLAHHGIRFRLQRQ